MLLPVASPQCCHDLVSLQDLCIAAESTGVSVTDELPDRLLAGQCCCSIGSMPNQTKRRSFNSTLSPTVSTSESDRHQVRSREAERNILTCLKFSAGSPTPGAYAASRNDCRLLLATYVRSCSTCAARRRQIWQCAAAVAASAYAPSRLNNICLFSSCLCVI